MSGEDPEWETYIQENDALIIRTKDEILRILNAFMQAGVDLDKENVLSKMTHRALYMLPEGDDIPKKELVGETNANAGVADMLPTSELIQPQPDLTSSEQQEPSSQVSEQ